MTNLDPTALPPGTVIDKYTVETRIASGGSATVYRVVHSELETVHALKIVHISDHEASQRLRTEGRVLAKLEHPNIVGVTDIIDVDGMPGLLMEYVGGPDLHMHLDAVGRLSFEELDDLAGQLLEAVEAAHEQGFIHRDLKPANIILGPRRGGGHVVKVADFGLDKVLESDSHTITPLHTRQGIVMGTPAYMAPEQVTGDHAIGRHTDIWALGTLLFEMVTGDRAFPGKDTMQVLGAVARGSYALPVPKDTPPRMIAAIRAALQIQPLHRPADCKTLLELWRGNRDFVTAESTLILEEAPKPQQEPPQRSLLPWIL
ncbi:MAG: serine/threonine protein kinase, partial [Proteobacteria bacterium]|nr:serine/threonine protein kinase [Pseudomonadota bacterium]